jgi:hypothetical protein
MTRTPEGFLVCHNVPLARTGEQKYLGSEVGKPEQQIVTVYRNEDEVFSRKTMASFEGKPVTDDHPPEFVLPENASGYSRGVGTNIRRGTGNESDLLIGDIIVYDAVLISEIEDGKREISAGYYCDYRECDGGLEQCNIVCNHIAVVHNGRAGDRVAIKDEESIKNKKKRGKSMGKKKGNILDRMFAAFVNDEDTTPEDIKEAAEAMKDDDGNSSGTTEPKTQQTGDEEVSAEEIKQAVSDALAPLIKRIEALETAKATDDGDDLEKLESELTDDDDSVAEEGTVEVDPNKINDDDDETSKTEEKKEGTVDKAIALQVLRAMKPMIAAMPDDQKKKATDGLRKALLGLTVDDTAKGKSDKAYQDLLKRKAQDAAIVKKNADFGIACRARNPHRKDGK